MKSSPGNAVARKRKRLEAKMSALGRVMRPLERKLRDAQQALKNLQATCKHPNIKGGGAVINCPDCHFQLMRF
ncbi:hypothetical protein EPO17_02255 [Patescibacteria group bacterium]|nr:MAG: hypothetical protein EPO17_02255 [Patescibacteria group bacterium]